MNYKIYALLVAVSVSLILIGCETNVTEPNQPDNIQTLAIPGSSDVTIAGSEISLEELMSTMNAKLETEGKDYRVYKAEYITAEESGEMGNTVIAKDVGNKQLDFDFVPNDDRRLWSGPVGGDTDDITYAIDQTGDAEPLFGGVSGLDATAAIQRAMGTWDAQTCSDLALTQNSDFGLDIGVVAFLNGLGGSPFIFADVQHAGFRDINFPGGILGVAFTFSFGTDIDDNGKTDTAFREIYYDPSFVWANDGAGADIETVALHEAGHGLSQAHFGKVMIKNNGDLKASPRAVMNALYAGPLRDLQGTDNGGHCSNWAQWPNN